MPKPPDCWTVPFSFCWAWRADVPGLIDADGCRTPAYRLRRTAKAARKGMSKLPGFDLIERARALAPMIASEADEIERTRRLTPTVVSALIENGLYRALLPKSAGGTE